MSNNSGPYDPYGSSSGQPSPYGDSGASNPYGDSGASPSPYDGGDPYGGGTPSPYADQGPYTSPAPAAPPSGGYPEPYAGGGSQGYQPPGSYAAPGAYGGGAYGGGAYGGYPPIPAYQNGAGGWSLGLGIATIVLCFVPGLSQALSVAAIITGVIGRKAASEGRANNGGMALAGIIIGGAGLLLSVLAVILWYGTVSRF